MSSEISAHASGGDMAMLAPAAGAGAAVAPPSDRGAGWVVSFPLCRCCRAWRLFFDRQLARLCGAAEVAGRRQPDTAPHRIAPHRIATIRAEPCSDIFSMTQHSKGSSIEFEQIGLVHGPRVEPARPFARSPPWRVCGSRASRLDGANRPGVRPGRLLDKDGERLGPGPSAIGRGAGFAVLWRGFQQFAIQPADFGRVETAQRAAASAQSPGRAGILYRAVNGLASACVAPSIVFSMAKPAKQAPSCMLPRDFEVVGLVEHADEVFGQQPPRLAAEGGRHRIARLRHVRFPARWAIASMP